MSSQMDQDISFRADISDQDRHGEWVGKMSCDATLRAELKKKKNQKAFLLLFFHSYLFLLSFYLSSLFLFCVCSFPVTPNVSKEEFNMLRQERICSMRCRCTTCLH